MLGRVRKGVKCSVSGCDLEATRSLPKDKVAGSGLEIGDLRRAYLCHDHYKEFKKRTRKDRMIEEWRRRT